MEIKSIVTTITKFIYLLLTNIITIILITIITMITLILITIVTIRGTSWSCQRVLSLTNKHPLRLVRLYGATHFGLYNSLSIIIIIIVVIPNCGSYGPTTLLYSLVQLTREKIKTKNILEYYILRSMQIYYLICTVAMGRSR